MNEPIFNLFESQM